MKERVTFLLLFSLLIGGLTSHGQSNNATLIGRITDEQGNPLDLVTIFLKDYPIGTTSNRKGEYLLRFPARRDIVVMYSFIGYKTQQDTLNAASEERIIRNVVLEMADEQLDEVEVTGTRRANGNITTLDPRLINSLPNPGSGSVEALIKTLPGVSSNNELSSQYSVRGGNFDENLVYVNDIEIYRPQLIRAGQQEGLSFINSDMVSSIEFSAGGFNAKYGDKMSSVLDIKYKKPTGFEGSASASLLGGSIHIEDQAFGGKLSHISGIRYKTNRYLLGSLDEQGKYDPRFMDIQTYLTWQVSGKFDLSFLGNFSNNQYNFYPEERETSFGTWDAPYETKIYFDGSEKDVFSTYLGAISANYHPQTNINLKFIASAYSASEKETYDILGEYYLNELERNMASENFGDSILNLGVGAFINHARNYLDARVYSFSHKGAYDSRNHLINWGFQIQHEYISDKINEWIYRDSTGYSLPYSETDRVVDLYYTLNSRHSMSSNRLTAYIQDTYNIPVQSGNLYLNAGIRGHFWDFNNQLLISPRISLSYYPDWEKNFTFRLAGGMYHQPAFYKELRDREGNINYQSKAQKSYQVLLGTDYIFTAWDRPFRFTTEAYYKHLRHLVPYHVDNVRIRYIADQVSNGFATGIDMKVNGEFVSGVQSWASLSVMKTMEDIVGDGHGFIPRPTDQLFNFSLFFQDYFPGNPSFKFHMTGFYGSQLPVGPPLSERWKDVFRMPSYRRIDIGFSKVLLSSSKPSANKWLKHLDDVSVNLEVFNLLNINNTISYFWVTSNWGDSYAVPNYLTGRMINLKFDVKF